MIERTWLNRDHQMKPGAEIFRSDRRFFLEAYSNSHGRLLLRSREGDHHDTTIDLLSEPVEALKMVLGPSLRQAIVPARLMGRVASTSRMLAMCAAPFGAFLGGWLATTYDLRTPLYAASALLLTMTAVTATMTTNRRVEAALRSAHPDAVPVDRHPAEEIAVHTTSR